MEYIRDYQVDFIESALFKGDRGSYKWTSTN